MTIDRDGIPGEASTADLHGEAPSGGATSAFSVLSINLGPRVETEIFGRRTLTAFAKYSVRHDVWIDEQGIVGDGHYGREGLEGRDHAVQLCCADHHAFWGRCLDRPLAPGAFGEAVTYQGPDERTLRIGDVLQVGSARLEISAPRLPCAKLAHFLAQDRTFVRRYHVSLKTGIYARVLVPGGISVDAAMRIEATDRSMPTVAEVAAMLLERAPDPLRLGSLVEDRRLSIKLRSLLAMKGKAVERRALTAAPDLP